MIVQIDKFYHMVVKYTSSWMEIKLTTLAAIDADFIRYCDHDDPLRKKEKFEDTQIFYMTMLYHFTR